MPCHCPTTTLATKHRSRVSKIIFQQPCTIPFPRRVKQRSQLGSCLLQCFSQRLSKFPFAISHSKTKWAWAHLSSDLYPGRPPPIMYMTINYAKTKVLYCIVLYSWHEAASMESNKYFAKNKNRKKFGQSSFSHVKRSGNMVWLPIRQRFWRSFRFGQKTLLKLLPLL